MTKNIVINEGIMKELTGGDPPQVVVWISKSSQSVIKKN